MTERRTLEGEMKRIIADRDAEIARLRETVRTQAALLAGARDGLKPFADHSNFYNGCAEDHDFTARTADRHGREHQLRVAELRRARDRVAEIDAANATGGGRE